MYCFFFLGFVLDSAHSQLNVANSKFLCGKFGLKTDLRSHVQYGKSSHGPRIFPQGNHLRLPCTALPFLPEGAVSDL